MIDKAAKQRDLVLAIGAFVVAFVLWQFSPFSPIVYPLRLFVTFIHELGHGVATILTGGSFVEFQVQSSGAGVAFSRGGSRPIIASAGYVGTAIFGATLLYVANSGKSAERPKWLAIGLGTIFALLTLLYTGLGLSNFNILEVLIVLVIGGMAGVVFLRAQTDDLMQRLMALALGGLALLLLFYFAAGDNLLTVMVGVLSGVALIGVGYSARRDYTLFLLNFLAFIVGLNAVTDAWVLLRIVSTSSRVPHNDATSMADAAILPAQFWAVMWIALAVGLLGAAIWLTFIRPMRRGL